MHTDVRTPSSLELASSGGSAPDQTGTLSSHVERWEVTPGDDHRHTVVSPVGRVEHWWTAVVSCADAETEESIARMIWAAPKLLAALKLAEAFMAGFEDDDLQDGINQRLGEIRAAIAKAEGRS